MSTDNVNESQAALEHLDLCNRFSHELHEIIGFDLPADLRQPFVWHDLRRRNAGKTAPNASKEDQQWLEVEWRLDHVRRSLVALRYHTVNVVRMEQAMDALIAQYRGKCDIADDGKYLFYEGLIDRVHFEFQAFTYVAVHGMSYLARCAGKVFGPTTPTLLCVKKQLQTMANDNHSDANAILAILLRYEPNLRGLYRPAGRGHSERDYLAHEGLLVAGSLHIRDGAMCVNGSIPDDFGPVDHTRVRVFRLSEVMEHRRGLIERFAVEMVEGLKRHCQHRITP